MRYLLVLPITVLSILSTRNPVVSQEPVSEPDAQEEAAPSEGPPRFFLRGEVGYARFHEGGRDSGILFGFRAGLGLDRQGAIRIEGGLTSSEAGYATLDIGFEVQPLPRGIITPLIGIAFGAMGESDYSGGVLRLYGGVAVRPTRRLAIRVVAQFGTHGGAEGPNALFAGVEVGL